MRLSILSVTFVGLVAFAQGSPNIGEVEQLRGAGFAQSEGQLPRIMGPGLALKEGDRLTTAADALAIIKLKDGTKMTLRPGTEMVLSQFNFADNSGNSNAMVVQLLRGGLRTLTGLITKASGSSAKIQTNTATIGIRGTDFDARICKAGECSGTAVANSAPSNIEKSVIAASARVLQQQGQINALNEQGQRRVLLVGGSIYPGDIVETAANSSALLAFRDESKVNLGAQTRLRIDDFSFDAAQPAAGRNFVALLRGSLRAVTGLIGKANRQNVRFSTNTATIGIRGTQVGMECTGLCAGDPPSGNVASSGGSSSGLTVFTFEGAVFVELTPPRVPAQTAPPQPPIELVAGRGIVVSGQVSATGLPLFVPLDTPPLQGFPDSPAGFVIPIDTFSQTPVADGAEGLFVHVRDGDIAITTERQQIDLGRNESAFSGPALQVVRLQAIPNHVLGDTVPLPTASNINLPGLRQQRSTDPICRQ